MRRLVLFCLLLIVPGAAAGAAGPTTTFAAAGNRAVTTMLHVFYAGHGLWNSCDDPICGRSNVDWGVDSLTYTLALRWTTKHDPRIAATLKELLATAPMYPAPCQAKPCGWSDVPAWDSIAASREYEILHDPSALAKAEAAFAYVEDGKLFALGACPQIRYQQPNGEANHLKTLETDANAIKAALLLYRATQSAGYLDSAVRHYSAVRSLFLRNAAATISARKANGAFGRFFDGPAPVATTTVWQSNGGLALMIAAAALDPKHRIRTASRWKGARYVAGPVSDPPASLTF